jgi:EmrB/QacA subfamily drug resistance transporter
MLSSVDSKAGNIPAAPTEPWKWRVLALVAFAFFIVVLDFSVVNVALPSIEKDLGFTKTNLQWVASSYAIVFGGFLLLGGRCSDILGRRRVLLAGVMLFTLASLIAGLAGVAHNHAREILIGCRAVQGLGGAFIAPAALSIVNTIFAEGAERNKAMGIFGSVATAGFAAGNLFGGILTGHFGWPSIFFVNVPLGILLLVIAPKLVPAASDEKSGVRLDLKTLDIGGAISVTAGLGTLVYGFVGAEQNGWTSPQTLGTLGIAAVLLSVFVWIESHVASPLIPLSIFKRRTLTTSNIVMLLIEGINAPTVLFLSLYLQGIKGFSPQQTGFAFLPLACWLVVAANLAPRVVTRFGVRPVLIIGTLLTTLTPLLLSRLTVESDYVRDILPILLISGTGMAGAITAGFIAATSGLANEEQGLASGLIQTSQQIGAALGLAVLVAVAASREEAAAAAGSTALVAQVAGLHAAFLVGSVLSGVGCLVAIVGIKPTAPAHPTVNQPEAVVDGSHLVLEEACP